MEARTLAADADASAGVPEAQAINLLDVTDVVQTGKILSVLSLTDLPA